MSTANEGVNAQDGALSREGVASAKFAINLASLGSEFRQQGGGSRRSGSTAIDIPAPLLRRFQGINRDALSADNEEFNAPVVYKGVAYVVQGRRLVAYDTDPGQDLDGFNGPDDGIPDYGNAFGADKIWQSIDLYGPSLSSPVVVEATNPAAPATQGNTDMVYVADRSGRLVRFSALNKDAQGVIRTAPARVRPVDAQPLDPPGGRAEYGSQTPNAPTVHDGLIYMADVQGGKGRVWVARASNGQLVRSTNPFKLGGAGTEMPPFSSGATIGSIPIADNSGGNDLVLYAPTAPNGSGANAAAGLVSLWIASQGESPVQVEAATGGFSVTTRAQQQGGPPIWCPTSNEYNRWAPRITFVDAEGNPMPAATLRTYVTGPATNPPDSGGVLFFPGSLPDPNIWSARVTYYLDWGGDEDQLAGIQRGTLNFPDTDNNQVVYGNIAMSGRGTIYATVGPRTPSNFGGSLYAFREEGRGTFRCLMRYDLYDEHFQVVNGARQTIRETYADNDLIRFVIPGTAATPALARLRRLRFTSSPVVRGDQVFAAATSTKKVQFGPIVSDFQSTILMAFRAEPLGVEIPVRGDAIPEGSSIIQKDMARSQDKTQPDQETQLQLGQYTYDANRGVIRIDNLMTTQKGPIQSALSTSMPIILRKPDGGDTILEPDRQGGRFSPLLWYTVLNGFNSSSTSGRYRPAGLFVSGNTLYTAGKSIIPSVLRGATSIADIKDEGLLTALDATIPSGDASLTADPGRPWQNQLTQFVGTSPANFRGSEHFRWPALRGIASGEDYGVRLNQTLLGDNIETAYGVVGGEGTLFSWSQRGVTAFRRSDLVVADSGRIGVYDAGGSPIFTTNSSVASGLMGEGSVGSLRPLVRPTRAYALGGQQLLVADPGSNRIARIAGDGVEVRSIDRFILDRSYVPRGLASGEPQTLNGPRDVVTWGEYVQLGAQEIVSDQRAVEYWNHYLIADSGNRRIVELIDRYRVDQNNNAVLDPVSIGGVPQLGVLVWHTPNELSGGDYEYNSLERVYIPGAGGRYVYVAGLGGLQTPSSTVGLDANPNIPNDTTTARGGNGSVIIFDPANPKGSSTIDRISTTGYEDVPMWDQAANGGAGVWRSANATPITEGRAVLVGRRQAQTRLLGTVNSVTARVVDQADYETDPAATPRPLLTIMVATNSGVYEFVPDDNSSTGTARWFLPNEAYTALRHSGFNPPSGLNSRGFRPTFARRLESGEVLVVNAYQGSNRAGGNVFGEVVQLSGDFGDPSAANYNNLGFTLASLRYELPPILGTRGLIQPLFADRR
ncbi:hypothetical protein EON79_06585 [bacterium]|nr:MAG: hypothetical protein EON79_06585 [bacterium]